MNTSCALIVVEPVKDIEASSSGQTKIEEIFGKVKDLLLKDNEKSDYEFYTLEELDEMVNKSHARKFTNLRFKRNHPFKVRPK